MVKALLAKGAEVNAQDLSGQTALNLAVRKGHTRIVEVLKKAGGVAAY